MKFTLAVQCTTNFECAYRVNNIIMFCYSVLLFPSNVKCNVKESWNSIELNNYEIEYSGLWA